MTVNGKHKRHPLVARLTPRFVLRTALLAGGGVSALSASALASYSVVSLLFPHAGMPGNGPAALPAVAYVAPAPVPVAPEMMRAAYEPPAAPIRIEPETRVASHVVPASFTSPRPVLFATAAVAPTRSSTMTASHAIPASFEVPTPSLFASATPSDTAPAVVAPADRATAFGPHLAALSPAPGIVPDAPADAAAPDIDFASLAAGDAGTRAGAGLFSGTARPELTPEPAVFTAAMPTIRPEPRPAGFENAVFTVATAAPAIVAPTASIRPAPRPDIVLASMSAPAATIDVAPPELTTKTGAKSGSGGFFSGGSSSCGPTLARAMPNRRGGATGSEFFAGLTNVSGSDRDSRVIAELARGNMPGFLHDLKPVTFQGQDSRGTPVEITICVTPDYLALGSDNDYIRTPLGLPAAGHIAGAFNMTLPTPRMVDAIYAQANVKLSPSPMQAGPQMSSTSYFVTHNATIQKQLQGRSGLIAGQKKDVVMASRLASHPGKVAIYGWHQPGGHPIQPVSTVHQASYADYSHGIRLVAKTAYLNGKAVSLDDLLSSSRYASLLNGDGPMPGQAIRVASN